MIHYNTTFSVASETATDWLHWTKRFYILAVLATELPTNYKLLRLLTELDNGGETYSLQFTFPTMEAYDTYQTNHADTLRQRIQHRFSNQYVYFETLLEEI